MVLSVSFSIICNALCEKGSPDICGECSPSADCAPTQSGPKAKLPVILFDTGIDIFLFQNTREEWRHVFYLTAAILGVSSIVYGLGASSELAPWSGQEPVEMKIEVKTHRTIVSESPYQERNRVDVCDGNQ